MRIQEKMQLRKEMLKQLKSLDRITYEHLSYTTAKRLYKTEAWNESRVIGVTVSKSPEADTWQIIRKGWEERKKIVVPKCHPADKSLSFREITSFNQLESVFYGLFEPAEEKTIEYSKEKIDLLLVPGLIYNRSGFRIGFGGGYYDRYLTDFSKLTISLAFSFQIKDEIPVETHDIPVQKIITDKEVINCTLL